MIFKFFFIVTFIYSTTLANSLTNNQEIYENISITACVNDTPEYARKIPNCGELVYVGVFKVTVVESIQKDLIGNELLIAMYCSDKNKKGKKYHILAKKFHLAQGDYLFYNDYENVDLPIYWMESVEEVKKGKYCCSFKKQKKKQGIPPRE